MPFFPSLPADAGPGNVFTAYPELYEPWADMSEALMHGPSPLSPGEREMIAAFVVGLTGCRYAYVAHSAAAYSWGVPEGLIDKLLENLETAPVEAKFKPLLAYARKLTLTPAQVTQSDADAVFAAGWSEKAVHDAVAVTARMNFMTRLVQGYGFTPMTPAKARENAANRKRLGYRNLYPAFAEKKA